jgi:peptidoglycan hydrolase-like protein with peptidoglycan-binding domain
MKKFVFIVLAVGLSVYLFGCGKKEQPLTEMQEPISIEELGKLTTQGQTPAPEVATKAEPAVAVPAQTQVGQLPPVVPSKPTTQEIQTALKNAGYYTGLIDGKIGPLTKKAIEDFPRANNLQVDGKVGPKTWALLGSYLNAVPTPSTPSKKR